MTRVTHFSLLHRLITDRTGSMAVETAIVAPILVLLALGSFDLGRIVTRQYELQGGIAEAESVALAANGGASTDTVTLKALLEESLSLTGEQVTIDKLYRCNADPALIADPVNCSEDDVVSSYIQIRLQDQYSPLWTKFGIERPFNFNVVRTVQLS